MFSFFCCTTQHTCREGYGLHRFWPCSRSLSNDMVLHVFTSYFFLLAFWVPVGKHTSHHSKSFKSSGTFESLRVFENLGEIFSTNVRARRDPYKISQMIGCMQDIENCIMPNLFRPKKLLTQKSGFKKLIHWVPNFFCWTEFDE
jgi:hypothetical protein